MTSKLLGEESQKHMSFLIFNLTKEILFLICVYQRMILGGKVDHISMFLSVSKLASVGDMS